LASVRVARPRKPCSGGGTDRSLITYFDPRSETLLRFWSNADSHTKTAAKTTEIASIEAMSMAVFWPGIAETRHRTDDIRRVAAGVPQLGMRPSRRGISPEPQMPFIRSTRHGRLSAERPSVREPGSAWADPSTMQREHGDDSQRAFPPTSRNSDMH